METKHEIRRDPQGYTTKVTRLGNGQYGCRVLRGTEVISEGKADSRADTGPVLRELLRWVNKLGGSSSMVSALRSRGAAKYAKGAYRNSY